MTSFGGVYRSWKWGALPVLGIAILLLWSAALNGGPFYHPDTPSYFRAAASGLFRITGLKTAWVDEYVRLYEPAHVTSSAKLLADVARTHAGAPVTLSGRSIYYGAFLYVAYVMGSTWLAVIAQAALTSVCIFMTVVLIGRAFGRRVSRLHTFLVGVATAALSPASYFTGQLMPGVLTGVAILATANLLFLCNWMPKAQKIFWSLALGYSLLAHTTNLMMVAGTTLIAVFFGLLGRLPLTFRQLSIVFGCIGVGMCGQLLFSQAVRALTGHAPVRPPFVAMRLIADGPGYAYLKEHCQSERFVYCQVLSRTDHNSDTLLWSEDPKVSLFRGLPPRQQRLAAAQQNRFIWRVLKSRPVEVISIAGENTISQLATFDLDNFNYSQGNLARYEETLPAPVLQSIEDTRAFHGTMPTEPVEMATMLITIVSMVFLIIIAARTDSRSVRGYILVVVAAILLNAAICGALSGPKGRYQMRLIWILPVIAGAAACSMRTSPDLRPEAKRLPA